MRHALHTAVSISFLASLSAVGPLKTPSKIVGIEAIPFFLGQSFKYSKEMPTIFSGDPKSPEVPTQQGRLLE